MVEDTKQDKGVQILVTMPRVMNDSLIGLKSSPDIQKQIYGNITRTSLIRFAIHQFIQRNKNNGGKT